MKLRLRSYPSLLFFACSALAGCASILGIDDLTPKTDSAHAGAGASGAGREGGGAGKQVATGGQGGIDGRGGAGETEPGSSGTPSSGGRGNGRSGGSSGGGAKGSHAAGSDGQSARVNAGAPGESGAGGSFGGAGAAGSAGEGGAPNTEGTPVRGTVIDVWGHPLSGVPVALGGEETQTDGDGAFTFADVPASYDVSLLVSISAPAGLYRWIYQGLTRRDPTLQVYRGLPSHDAELQITQKNGAFTENSQWLLGLGSPNGSVREIASQEGIDFSPSWEGTTEENHWTIHGLLFEQTRYLPTAYTAYDSVEADVSTSDPKHSIALDFGKAAPTSAYVSGTVNSAIASDRNNYALVRFASGAALPVIDDVTATEASFSYLMPNLPGGTITLAASAGNTYSTGYALAHQNGLVPGATNIELEIPAPPVLTRPADGDLVTSSTSFAFESGAANVGAFVVSITDPDFHGIYLVTSKTEFTWSELSVVNGRFPFTSTELGWDVETHGTPASVDEMCGPAGFIDEFANSVYPARDISGSFTRSVGGAFTTAAGPTTAR